MNQITISYLGQNYVVPLTTNLNDFYIESTAGNPITVDSGTAANLFGAEKAVLLLENLHNVAGIESLYASWNNVITTTATTLSLEGLSDALASITGSLIVSAITGGAAVATIATGAAKAIGPALIGLTPSVADLALVSTLFSEAENLLSGADSTYYGFSTSESPIQFDTIRSTINDTLLALGIGDAATEASQQIPGVNDSFYDDLVNFASNLIGPVVDLANVTGSILNTVASSLETNILGTADIGGHLDAVNALVNQVNFGDYLTSQIAQIIENSTYGPLTDSGLQTVAESLSGSSYVQPSTPAALYAISSPPTIYENSGTVNLTISRSDTSSSETVYVSTVPDQGTSNPNGDYYYNGNALDDFPVYFDQGVSSASVSLTINDLGLTFGSESFRIIAQSQKTDPITTYLASTIFTIQNQDPVLGSYSISPAAPTVSESAGSVFFTLTRSDTTKQATVYVSTVHSGESENFAGDYYYQGILDQPASFNVGQSTDNIQLVINDLGLSSGSETFEIIAQADPADPVTDAVASTTFTINNDDGSGGSSSAPPAATPTVESEPLSVQLNATTSLTSSFLDASDAGYSDPSELTYIIISPPTHGSLVDNGVVGVSTFTQADINSGLLQYRQNGGNGTSDGFTFEVVDPAGNHTVITPFVITIPAPTPPPQTPGVTIELADDTGISSTDGVTSDPALRGTADGGATVVLSEGGTTLGSTTPNSAGVWTFTPTGLAQGSHTIKAAETNGAGLTGYALLDFDLDLAPPDAPSTPSLSGGGTVTPTATPTFSGTTNPADNAIVELVEGDEIIGTGPSIGGSWSISTSPLTEGGHSITAVAVDPAGNDSSPSAVETFSIVTPPPGEVVLNDATMVGAGGLGQVGQVVDKYYGAASSDQLTEYGPVTADGFTITNLNRSQFDLIAWNASWAFDHNVADLSEYSYGPDVLIIPTNGLLATNPLPSGVPAATADTIDLRRADGSAFSLSAIDLGPTGYGPTWAIFTGTTAAGDTVSETFELDYRQGIGLQTVTLTGFGDVTDVRITSSLDGASIPTSVAFDNVVLGTAQPPPAPPAAEPLTAPVTLDDSDVVAAGETSLIATDENVFTKGVYSTFGSITADGFVISNLSRADFAFEANNSAWDAVEGYYYDGSNVFLAPIGTDGNPSVVSIDRADGSQFSFLSIGLDTMFAGQQTTVTFTGTEPDNSQVSQTVTLDTTPGLQIFQLGTEFDDVSSVEFVASSGNVQFDSITLAPPTGIALPSISGAVAGQQITDVATLQPFADIVIADPDPSQTETATVTLSTAANGVLSSLGSGSYDSSTGVYSVAGSATAVTAAIDGLVFTPTPHQFASGQTVTTTLTVTDTDTPAGQTATDSTTSVVVTDTAAATLTIVNSTSISAQIGTQATLTTADLNISDSGYPSTQVTYAILSGPTYGSLVENGQAVTQFTQADINSGAVTYQEDGSIVSSDSFTFQASDPGGNQTSPTIFQIQILPRAGATSPIVLQPGPNDSQQIWTTSVYSYAPGGSTPGGGLADGDLRVGGYGDLYYSLLQFNLSDLPSTASSAELILYDTDDSTISPTAINLEEVTSPWDWQTSGTGRDHDRLWWADRPSTVSIGTGSLPVAEIGSYYTIDITNLYNGWQNGTIPNYGIELQPVSNNNNFDYFASSRSTNVSERPELVIVPATPRTLVWTGASGNSATSPANWNDTTDAEDPAAAAPSTSDTALFTGGAADITGSLTVAQLLLTGNETMLLTSGASLSATGTITVGETAAAQLAIGQAGLTGGAAVIADQSGAGGSAVSADNAGSSWQIAGPLVVGNAASASLNISSGATVTASSLDTAAQSTGDGVISVTGTGSSLTLTGSLTLGDQAAGELSILGGATVSAQALTIGNANAASSGNVDVEGAGSTLHIATGGVLNVGYAGGGSGELTIGQGSTLQFSGGVVEAGRASYNNNGGVIDPDSIEFTTASNAGLGENDYNLYVGNINAVQVTSGTGTWDTPMVLTGTSVSDATNNIQNNGDIGEWQLSNSGTLIVNANTVDSGQAIIFEDATDTLVIGQVVNGGSAGIAGVTPTIAAGAENLLAAGGFAAEIWGYQSGDRIEFNNLVVNSDSIVGGNTLDLFGNGGTLLGSLVFLTKAGNHALGSTAMNAAAAQIECFAAGTRIRTTRGEVKVEALREGDLTITSIDGSEAPVVWIGHREVDCARHPDPRSVWPVRIRAGAFGRGLPKRALTLSPDHAVYVNEVLVPVKHLINGTTIAQVKVDRVTYYHVELDRHDVLIADGLPAESYLDVGDRANFANGGAVVRLHIDLAHHWEAGGCAPLVIYGPELEGVGEVVAAHESRGTPAPRVSIAK